MMELYQALQELRTAIQEHAEAAIARLRAKEALEEALARAIVEGQIQGRNEEERKARARSVLADYYQKLAEAEEALIWAKAQLDIAKYWVEGLNALAQGGKEEVL